MNPDYEDHTWRLCSNKKDRLTAELNVCLRDISGFSGERMFEASDFTYDTLLQYLRTASELLVQIKLLKKLLRGEII